ncbi:arylmalonate decarboxylase [Mesorhizobium sp. M2A.F.Ca.ET.043.05.1.1]|uniref:maleate cis-trans isomerase family protein n=1 Tax=Mesorhizobium sp. M2A.F.Ca.ET.043.05.1.1 TaxID=2493671 RepID=UPI000F760F95|nr:arylmalonate decarboxylase [Mesorhizobium sp. M2A.F.Ca.ET.043.05.1.1]AZO18847.1 arylmalonate decarboxylase [Mesorhizobium sp. M2A.F.Ca.ET.043.05.1.1]
MQQTGQFEHSLGRGGIRFDAGRHHKAKLGFVLLAMEQTIEEDMFKMAPDGVGVHFQRAPMANKVEIETLSAMASGIGDAAALIVPEVQLDVICYGCTSGSVVIGEDKVFAELTRGAPGAKPTSIISGVMRALKAVNARKITVATPYVDPVNEIERVYMAERGFEILNMQGLNIENDEDMVRVTPDYIYEFAKQVDRADSDAIFISCSALRSVDIIQALEAESGKPVITSNQAMMWDCLRLAGVNDRSDNYGRLFKEN